MPSPSIALPVPSRALSAIAASPVLLAIYGYWSTVRSRPRDRASSISASESFTSPQFASPLALWCEICTGQPASSPMRIASATASSSVSPSPRMCEA